LRSSGFSAIVNVMGTRIGLKQIVSSGGGRRECGSAAEPTKHPAGGVALLVGIFEESRNHHALRIDDERARVRNTVSA
jgi:hypothetical protein